MASPNGERDWETMNDALDEEEDAAFSCTSPSAGSELVFLQDCVTCCGSGIVRANYHNGTHYVMHKETCHSCGGAGSVPNDT
jgi:DnaJ-class molecular chaperone